MNVSSMVRKISVCKAWLNALNDVLWNIYVLFTVFQANALCGTAFLESALQNYKVKL